MTRTELARMSLGGVALIVAAGLQPMTVGVALAQETVVAVQTLRIGGPEDPYAMAQVVQVASDESGRIYVLDRLDNAVKVYDSQGAFLSGLGREGEGPGEFRRPQRMGFVGDTIWVLEPQSRRLSFFTLDGRVEDTRQFRGAVLNREGFLWAPASLLADGSMALFPLLAAEAYTSGRLPAQVSLRRVTADEVEIEPLAEYWSGQSSLVMPGDRGALSVLVYQPFDDGTLWAMSLRGTYVLTVERASKAAAGRVSVALYDVLDDSRSEWGAYVGEARAVTNVVVDSVLDIAEGMIRSRGRSDIERSAVAEALYNPGFLPSVDAALVDPAGRVWLRNRDRGDVLIPWNVYDHAGRILGKVELPSTLVVHYVAGGCIWGVESDELRIQYIVRYAVEGLEDLACSAPDNDP